jgi:acyl-CoA synthetase (NDP forming)
MTRPLYRHDQLARLLAPSSIAIIGASARPGAFGERVLANLSGYGGAIWPVNARYQEIGGRPCFASLAALPAPPDCAIVCVPQDAVAGVMAECVEARVGGTIVFASGYAEVGTEEGIALQAELASVARTHGIPIMGPNTIGSVNARLGAAMTFMGITPIPPPRARGAIGLVSQSGALGMALAQSVARGVSISHVLTSGNSCDIDVADGVAYLADDPACDAIACVFEGMAEPRRLLAAIAHARASDKPVVIFKMATGTVGAAAAMSHTGSLAGPEAAYRAAFAQAGAVLVEHYEALIPTAAFLAKARHAARPAPGAGVAVLATSGGAAIMAADRAEEHGVPLPQPDAAAREVLTARIPPFGSARNPVDVTAQVLNDPDGFRACADALLDDPAYSALVVPHVYAYERSIPRLAALDAAAGARRKPVCMVWHSEWIEGPGATEIETAENLALFRSVDHCFAALASWQRVAVPQVSADARAASRASPRDGARAAGTLLRTAIAAGGAAPLSERESKQVLACYGVPVTEERLASDREATRAAAEAIGYPVALKAECVGLAHKTEAGVIALDIRDEAALDAAYDRVTARAIAAAGAERLAGVLVQRMVPKGIETVVGGRIDKLFGPLVLVGFGGILVEILADTALMPAPVTAREARAMVDGLRGARLLDGVRGGAAVDRGRLADIVQRVSELIADHAEIIVEIDVNPLIAAPSGIVAVDALIIPRGGGAA